jgi:hypothetical protein
MGDFFFVYFQFFLIKTYKQYLSLQSNKKKEMYPPTHSKEKNKRKEIICPPTHIQKREKPI